MLLSSVHETAVLDAPGLVKPQKNPPRSLRRRARAPAPLGFRGGASPAPPCAECTHLVDKIIKRTGHAQRGSDRARVGRADRAGRRRLRLARSGCGAAW